MEVRVALTSRATTASAVATSVTSVRTMPARSAPRIGRTLFSPDAHPDRHRQPPEPSRIQRDDALPKVRADEPSIEVERGDEDLADRLGGVQVVLGGRRPARRRSRPARRSRTATTSTRSHSSTIALHAGVRDERPLRGRVVHEPGSHQAARPGRPGSPRPAV